MSRRTVVNFTEQATAWASKLEQDLNAAGFRLTLPHRHLAMHYRERTVTEGTLFDALELAADVGLPPGAARILEQALTAALVDAHPDAAALAADPRPGDSKDPRWAARAEDPPTIAALRAIVRTGTAAKVVHREDAPVLVDLFSASAVVQVYDGVNDANKAKLLTFNLPGIVKVVFKTINSQRSK